jgi:glyoxylase-like metal-dependent hydrolase (beta-lactamase superfamily II)
MVKLKQFSFNSFQVSSFVLYDQSGACLIIDPGCNNSAEQHELAVFISANQLRPQAIVNTHGHIDHLLGVDFCRQCWKIPFLIHKDDLPLVRTAPAYAGVFGLEMAVAPIPDSYLLDDQIFGFGESELRILHVPGHSPGSIAIFAAEDNFVITGDALFAGSIGRTDLPGGDADTLLRAIREKLFTLPDETIAWPGHGPSTTIGIEKVENPYLQ